MLYITAPHKTYYYYFKAKAIKNTVGPQSQTPKSILHILYEKVFQIIVGKIKFLPSENTESNYEIIFSFKNEK